MLTIVSLVLAIIGGLNWFVVGVADFNFISWVFSGNLYVIARILYVIVGLAGLWLIGYLVRKGKSIDSTTSRNEARA